MSDKIAVMGLIATIITLVYTCFGLPVQIAQNFRNKSTEGISLVMMFMVLCTFTSWVIYAAIKPQPDWYVIISNAPGALCIMVIFIQAYLYRGAAKKSL